MPRQNSKKYSIKKPVKLHAATKHLIIINHIGKAKRHASKLAARKTLKINPLCAKNDYGLPKTQTGSIKQGKEIYMNIEKFISE